MKSLGSRQVQFKQIKMITALLAQLTERRLSCNTGAVGACTGSVARRSGSGGGGAWAIEGGSGADPPAANCVGLCGAAGEGLVSGTGTGSPGSSNINWISSCFPPLGGGCSWMGGGAVYDCWVASGGAAYGCWAESGGAVYGCQAASGTAA